MKDACRWPANPGSVIGSPCHWCGHSNLLHPGSINPAIVECLACALEVTLDNLCEMLRQAEIVCQTDANIRETEQGGDGL